MRDMNHIVGTHDIVFITLDTLRFDVADEAMTLGLTPNLTELLSSRWEKRHSPGSFTYAAHHAFFGGFLPTPAVPGRHQRLFAAQFGGSETTGERTFAFKEANLPAGLKARGYTTICLGGVGFFNQQTELGCVFPNMFDIAEWSRNFGVTSPNSTELQFRRAAELLSQTSGPVFLFINVSAIHQPNHHYVPGLTTDSLETHRAALQYVDSCVPILREALAERANVFGIVCADHGTAYGEDGFSGHRIPLPCVMEVPYAEFNLSAET